LDEAQAWAKEHGIDGLKSVKEALKENVDPLPRLCKKKRRLTTTRMRLHWPWKLSTSQSMLRVSDTASEVVAKYMRLSEAAAEITGMLSKLKL